MNAETADILDRAAEVIERNGWHQGDYFNRDQEGAGINPADCAVCTRGAINIVATGGNPVNDYDVNGVAAAEALDLFLWDTFEAEGRYGIAPWNDAPERTAAEVIAVLREAAAAERERAA